MSQADAKKVSEAVRRIISETFKVQEDLVKNESLLKDHLGLDSVDLLDIVGLAEREFKIKILEDGNFRARWPLSVNDLIEIIKTQIAKQS
jgi:acyl carrier protein